MINIIVKCNLVLKMITLRRNCSFDIDFERVVVKLEEQSGLSKHFCRDKYKIMGERERKVYYFTLIELSS